MKKAGKTYLSVLLAAALLCSMLLPAGAAWARRYPLCALASPNGEVWVDRDGYYNGSWIQYGAGDTPVTVYSPDGSMWLTAEGAETYYGTQEGWENWCSAVLNDDFSSPDGGMLWFNDFTTTWYDWEEFWEEYPERVRLTEFWMLSENPTTYWSHPLASPCQSFASGDTSVSSFHFGVSSRMEGGSQPNGLLFSTLMYDLCRYDYGSQFSLYPNIWLPDLHMQYDRSRYANNYPYISDAEQAAYDWAMNLQTPVSLDPNTRQMMFCNYGVDAENPNVLYSSYLDQAQPGYSGPVRTIVFKAPCDCEAKLNICFNAPANYYGMVQIGDLLYACGIQNSVPESLQNGRVILNGTQNGCYGSSAYRPICTEGAFTDTNSNGVLEESEAPDALGDPVYTNAGYDLSQITFTLRAGVVYEVPVTIWNEGQSPYSPQESADINFQMSFDLTPLQENAAPFYYTTDPMYYDYYSNPDGVIITGCDLDFLCNGLAGNYSSPYLSAFDFGTQTLTIPSEIAGRPVTTILDDTERTYGGLECFDRLSLRNILTEGFMASRLEAYQNGGFGYYPYISEASLRTLILPDSVRTIESWLLGNTLRTVHVPHDAAFGAEVFAKCPDDLTICSSTANSLTQQTIGDIRSFRYTVCTDHSGHVHDYTAVVTPPGYLHEGFTRYTCVCGDSYDADYTETLPTPICTAEGAAGRREQSVTIHAQLQNIDALTELDIHLDYDKNMLRFETARCEALPDPEIRGNDTLYWRTLPGADAAQAELTFTILPDATAGSTIVSISGEGVSACDVDGAEAVSIRSTDVPIEIAREAALQLTVPAAAVHPGETVRVTADVTKNTGLVGLQLSLDYDPAYLTLTDVQAVGMLQSGSTLFSGANTVIPFGILWDDALATESHTETGTILVFTFTVNEIEQGNITTPITLRFQPTAARNALLQTVPLTVQNASLKINLRISGDASGDGQVDLKDAVLMARALVGGWDADPDILNADVDSDGVLTLADVILLKRFLAGGWGVVLP